jgi:integrase/recombinase XerC
MPEQRRTAIKGTSAQSPTPDSIDAAVALYLDSVALARSPNTARTYRQALRSFRLTLARLKIDPSRHPAREVSEDWITAFAADLKPRSPATERLYLTAASGWYEFVAAERRADVNMARLHLLIRQRARRPGQRLPQFPRDAIERVLAHTQTEMGAAGDPNERLRHLRDRAFLLTLADTGLRVHEACRLRRGDLDWDEAQALLIGKGNRQAVVRFSKRSLRSLREYLRARSSLDGASGKALSALPVFARHDRGAGKRVLPITTTTGRTIVHDAVVAALGDEAAGTITPHSFRHYFVTTVLRGSGGNLKLAQELARHRNIAVTQRYAHLSDDELDRGYHAIFDESKDSADS